MGNIHLAHGTEDSWPECMPYLQTITISGFEGPIPQSWRHYTALQCLDIDNSDFPDLPEWFSEMQSLTKLVFCDNSLTDFPQCLLHLSSLHYLSLRVCGRHSMQIPANICDICEWPHISYLRLVHVNGRGQFDMSYKISLLRLERALGERSSLLHL